MKLFLKNILSLFVILVSIDRNILDLDNDIDILSNVYDMTKRYRNEK